MEIPYKENYENGLYSYTFISGHHCYNEEACKKEFETLNNLSIDLEEKKFIIDFIKELFSDKYILLISKFTPALFSSLRNPCLLPWEYLFYSNDFTGTCSDKGFIKNPTEDMLAGELTHHYFLKNNLPDVFYGESTSDLTLMGFSKEKNSIVLEKLLNDKRKPLLTELLKGNDIFAHLSLARTYGYFDSFIIKSKETIPILV